MTNREFLSNLSSAHWLALAVQHLGMKLIDAVNTPDSELLKRLEGVPQDKLQNGAPA